MASKITGTPDFEKYGLKFYVRLHSAKKQGKDRIWISIRQDNKEWTTTKTLSYQKAIDILFLK